MSIAHAMWIHGNGIVAESPERIAMQCFGFFIRVVGKPNTDNWLHAVIPTPVIVDGERLRVNLAMVRYRTRLGATLTAVHIYDGEQRIEGYDGLQLTSPDWVRHSFNVRSQPHVQYGVGISMQVTFGPSTTERMIEISAAGCDFVV